MRLTSIKLSGFKSFVDPTNIEIHGQLVGVVGPNGCGKSNIIDAVRWVLGETRASELRGESMRDVIFNGTTERRPSGRASVELAFDNEEGRVIGQWGTYDELAVRRVLTREGNSSYHINSQNVRRRDIQEIFMGTGLGPRAYAIIGQGMIARIIEARPEELRIYLEEAAGVSRYRERRRETENRLQDTRENLTRVSDILLEISQSLEKLVEQAEVAGQYQALQMEQDHTQKLLWMLEKRNAERTHARLVVDTEKARVALEALNADVVRHDRVLEDLRTEYEQATKATHAAQGQLYQTNASIGALETEIRYVIESRTRLQAQIGAYALQHEQWKNQEETAQAEYEALLLQLQDMEKSMDQARLAVSALENELPDVEKVWRNAQEARTGHSEKTAQLRQQIALASVSHKNSTRTLDGLATRRERLLQESRSMEIPDGSVFETLQKESAQKERELADQHERLATLQGARPELEEKLRQSREQVEKGTATLAQISAQQAALIQLQERAFAHGETSAWLKKYELSDLQPLWHSLQIEPGWETALESVLSERIHARELSRLEWVESFMADPPAARLGFFTTAQKTQQASHSDDPENRAPIRSELVPLLGLLQFRDSRLEVVLSQWLNTTFVASSLGEALEKRAFLPDGGSLVLRQGHVVDRFSVRFYAPESEKEGMFVRQQEIDSLSEHLKEGNEQLRRTRQTQQSIELEVAESGREIQERHKGATALATELHALQLQLVRLTEQKEHYLLRSSQIESVLEEILLQEKEQQKILETEEARMEALDAELADQQMQEEAAREWLLEKERALTAFRQLISEGERKAQEVEFAAKSKKNRADELTRQIQSAKEHALSMLLNVERDQAQFEALDDKVAQQSLHALLETRVEQSDLLTKLHQSEEDVAQKLRQEQEKRQQAGRELEPQREAIVAAQLKEQAARIHVEQFAQKLEESGADIAALTQQLHPGLSVASLSAEVSRIAGAIAALGAVNLAAAGELSQAQQRRDFLNEQHLDLTTAIETLESAIRRIDLETRTLLQDTFDQVNAHLLEIFPILFGGGHASLIMTGDEILDAGVQIMVQPPGKKNVSIHLLSGGEKALSAIALVFSLFQLNPAPFCLLDEVDSPLDDINTERFCNMVRRMSAKTQFLFVSHNKIAMEMAQQLIGVTMQEQGVSRIVSVDMEREAD